MELQPGQTIGDYEVLRPLGAGGMGKVYQVRHVISNRIEAMKVLLPGLMNEPELVDRFLREIRISASLEHPNIAQLRTAQRVGDQLIMIMEYVEGSTLDALMHAGRIPMPQAADYLRQALGALGYAHARGVVHRDIKPGNIFVTPTGVVKLMDFGIAKAAADQKLTKTGLMVGSVFYMSPEQIEGRDLDSRSDLYSLGVTLYEIATGQRPFNGDSEYKIMAAHLREMPVPPRDLDLSLSPELNAIILKALAKDPNRRFQTAEEFSGALERFVPKVQTQDAPRVSAIPQPARQPNARMKYMVAGSVVTIGVLAAAIVAIPRFQHASATAPASQAAAPPATTPQDPEPSAQPPEAAPVSPAPSGLEQKVEKKEVEQKVEKKPSAPVRPAVAQTAAAPQSSPAQADAQPPAAQPQPPVQPAAPAPAVNPEIGRQRERMMLMSVRVGAIRTSLQNLRQEMARSGLSLRSDMVAADMRMELQMNSADAALNQGSADEAKSRLDSAERELERLESFLNK